MMKLSVIASSLLLAACATPFIESQPVDGFIHAMHDQHQFKTEELQHWLADAVIKDDILQKMAKPAEAMPWYKYRKIFLTDARIDGGVQFWKDNAAALQRAEQQYGVPPEIIVAILGVETNYGKHQGKYRVIDALATLAFAYPPRSQFFLGELENFLLLCREQGLNPALPIGSYAGAMGMPQFMPSSFRRYAVDFDGNQQRDIWHSKTDIIGSVAQYFAAHHWQKGHPIAVPMTAENNLYKAKITPNLKPDLRLAELESLNLKISVPLALSEKIKILELKQEQSEELWAVLENFYVITRYNHSPLYAMAVYQLSQSILNKKGSFP